jgi:hypothetical protein
MRDSIGKISTKVYGKPAWSGLYLNYNSFVPMKYKIGLLRNMLSRMSCRGNGLSSDNFVKKQFSSDIY